jgi:hypothetical protein
MKLPIALALASVACLACLNGARGQAVPKGRVENVPDDIRQAVIAEMQRTFVYPQLVIWKFDYMQPYPTEGIAVCGRVNFPSSTRHYVGEQQFFAHLTNGEVIGSGIVAHRQNEDPVFASAAGYKIACGPR